MTELQVGDQVSVYCPDDGCREHEHRGKVTHIRPIAASTTGLTIVTFVDWRGEHHQAASSLVSRVDVGGAA